MTALKYKIRTHYQAHSHYPTIIEENACSVLLLIPCGLQALHPICALVICV